MKVFQIVGYHNSGKTTLVEFLAEELKKRGYRVGYVKHDPKGKGITDKEGSDTHRVKPFTEKTALVSPGCLTLWWFKDFSLREVLKFFEDLDVVLVEGFKTERGFPKIAVGEIEDDLAGRDEIIFRVRGGEDYGRALEEVLKVLNSQ
ncbi:MAG TPA: molybdopterin-guanine dinucleotide biosynthesis protein B [Aquifex sp.]|nr:molybdopterin-guanine dinucleotide biosynthesis protein B [Aquifex sp.]